jgi:hypothetical protein
VEEIEIDDNVKDSGEIENADDEFKCSYKRIKKSLINTRHGCAPLENSSQETSSLSHLYDNMIGLKTDSYNRQKAMENVKKREGK